MRPTRLTTPTRVRTRVLTRVRTCTCTKIACTYHCNCTIGTFPRSYYSSSSSSLPLFGPRVYCCKTGQQAAPAAPAMRPAHREIVVFPTAINPHRRPVHYWAAAPTKHEMVATAFQQRTAAPQTVHDRLCRAWVLVTDPCSSATPCPFLAIGHRLMWSLANLGGTTWYYGCVACIILTRSNLIVGQFATGQQHQQRTPRTGPHSNSAPSRVHHRRRQVVSRGKPYR
jgi:hypothetical protein